MQKKSNQPSEKQLKVLRELEKSKSRKRVLKISALVVLFIFLIILAFLGGKSIFKQKPYDDTVINDSPIINDFQPIPIINDTNATNQTDITIIIPPGGGPSSSGGNGDDYKPEPESPCVPDCGNRECGGDGCGGSCGTCDIGDYCSYGVCESIDDLENFIWNTSYCGDLNCDVVDAETCANCPVDCCPADPNPDGIDDPPRIRVENIYFSVNDSLVTYTYQIQADEFDGQDLTYFEDNLPNGAILNSSTGILSWTINSSYIGIYENVRFTVSDGNLNSSDIVDIIIKDSKIIYVDNQLMDNCSGDYSIANRDCSGSDGDAYVSVQVAADNAYTGDTVYIRNGTYRESIRIPHEGQANNLIIFKAYNNEDVIVDGSEILTGWQQCDQVECPNNSNYANIYYTTVDWNFSKVFENNEWITNAREPDFGYINTTRNEGELIIYSSNFTENPDYYLNALIDYQGTNDRGALSYDQFKVINAGGGWVEVNLSGLGPHWGEPMFWAGTNPWVYFRNKLEYVDRPGEWAVDRTVWPYRIYLWPKQGGNPNNYKIEAPKRNNGITLSGWPLQLSYIVFDGIDVAKVCKYPSHNAGNGYTLGSASKITIQNAEIWGNEGGITNRNPDGYRFINNHIYWNQFGITNGANAWVQRPANMSYIIGNNIHHNQQDGVTIYSETYFIVKDNHIHHHTTDNTHTDNFQTAWVGHIYLLDNTFHDGGQDVIMQYSDNVVFSGNIVYNAKSRGFVFDRYQRNLIFEGNTIGYSRYAPMAGLINRNTFYKNNYFETGFTSLNLNAGDGHITGSDYNYFSDKYVRIGYGGISYSIEDWLGLGFDTHSTFGGSVFKNVPLGLHIVNYWSTRNTLKIDNANKYFKVGDIVEYCNDGIIRKVTGVDLSNIIIDIPLDYDHIGSNWACYVLHWGGNTDVEEDYRVLGNACTASANEKVVGSTGCYNCTSASPLAFFTMNKDSIYDSETIYFDAFFSRACSGSVSSYQWDFGDGNTATGEQVEHIFDAGDYNITLTVTNTDGLSSSYKKSVHVVQSLVKNLNLYLKLNNTLLDSSGKFNHGVWKNSESYGVGIEGSAVKFDGLVDGPYFIVKDMDLLRGMDKLSISVWAKKENASQGGLLVYKHTQYYVDIREDRFVYYINNGTQSIPLGEPASINDADWHLYTMVYNGSVFIGYVDGVEAGRRDFTGKIHIDPSRDIYFGRTPWSSYFNGSADEVKIYSKALSETEVQDLYCEFRDANFCTSIPTLNPFARFLNWLKNLFS